MAVFVFFAPHMFVEPRQNLHKNCTAGRVIELMHQDLVPGVLAGARRARQAENLGRDGDAGGGPRLDRRSANLFSRSPAGTWSRSRPSVSRIAARSIRPVTSRPVKKVPPVVMTTSMNLFRDPGLHAWRIASRRPSRSNVPPKCGRRRGYARSASRRIYLPHLTRVGHR